MPDHFRDPSDVRLTSSVDVSVPDAFKITGSACSLADFLQIYNKTRSPWERPLSYRLLVHLDMPYAKDSDTLNPSHGWHHGHTQKSFVEDSLKLETAEKEKQRQLQGLDKLGPVEDILLLKLGSPNAIIACALGGMIDGKFYRTDTMQSRRHMALLLRRVWSTCADGTKSFERLGVCTWLMNAPLDQKQYPERR